MTKTIEGLTKDALRAHRRAICDELSARLPGWGGRGYSFRGLSPNIHVEVEVSAAHQPGGSRENDLWIHIPRALGGRLKVFAKIPPKKGRHDPLPFWEPLDAGVTQPLAPGARIFVRSRSVKCLGGIAAVVELDGRIHLLTCAHIFESASEVFVEPLRDSVATLSRAYLDDDDPLDAAVCELSATGVDLLDQSVDAPTWFSGCHPPDAGDNDGVGVFWPTSVDNHGPYQVEILSFFASTSVLFRRGRQDGLIEVSGGVVWGDSGSVLSLNGEYYGLCSGEVQGRWSFFTPIASVLDRLRSEYREVRLWHP